MPNWDFKLKEASGEYTDEQGVIKNETVASKYEDADLDTIVRELRRLGSNTGYDKISVNVNCVPPKE